MPGLPHKKKLNKEEQAQWEDRLIKYTNYLNLFKSAIAYGVVPKVQALKKSKERDIILASCDSILALTDKVYDILHDAFEDVRNNSELDFEAELPFPPPPLGIPTKDTAITWVQLSWGIISGAINVVTTSFAAIRVYWSPLEAAVNKLIEDLGKIFGPPKQFSLQKGTNEPNEFPAIISFDLSLPPMKKLTPEEKKRWEKSLIQYANYVSIFQSFVLYGVVPAFQKQKDGPRKTTALANCDSINTLCEKIYDILQETYGSVVKNQVLSFQNELPLPLPLLTEKTTNVVETAQLTWGLIDTAVILVAFSFPAAKVYQEAFAAGGNQLMKDLAENFGLPQKFEVEMAKVELKEFPVLASRRK